MRERVINFLCWLGTLVVGVGLVCLLALPALAQEGHAKYHEDFYSKWERPNGLGSCCNNDDCHPIDDKDLRTSSTKLEARIRNEWVEIPKELIRPYTPPDLQSHICNMGKNIFCFVYGGGT